MFNPYYIYIYSFMIVVIVYCFGWSDIFPEMKNNLILFLLFTFNISFFMGLYIRRKKLVSFYKIENRKSNIINLILVLLVLCYCVEFLYHKSIPLLGLFNRHNDLNYQEFGIPTFHVFLVTFNSFFSVYLFHLFLSTYSRKILFNFLFTIIPSVLIVNRGMLLIIITSCLFLYLIKLDRLKVKTIMKLTIASVIVLYLFGVFGNMRVNNSYGRNQDPFDSTVILTVGSASNEFRESIIPNPFFWGYLYIASPMANLQYTINNNIGEFNVVNMLYYINNELVFDFIGKRINNAYLINPPKISQISPELTVGTLYARSYVFLGWLGPILTFLYLIITSFFYLVILKKIESPYYLTGVAIMSSLFLFSTFTNMISFSGLSFQLIYPVIFSIFNPFSSVISKSNKFYKKEFL
jgi:oligosaccharide repeat unit polymerase